jgi:ketosteroid isomerase-like protein
MDRLYGAEVAIHNGDAGPRRAMWSRTAPVTLFGAAMNGSGWAEVEPIFDKLEASFANCTSYRNEVIAAGASGDLAYIVALEHTTVSINGTPRSYVLRATTVFRREDGDWRVVHRHGDPLTTDDSEAMQRLAGGSPDTS